jgi:hypothetical protein
MRIWNFIFAKLPNNKYLEVFLSLNYPKKGKIKNGKNKPPEPAFLEAIWQRFMITL